MRWLKSFRADKRALPLADRHYNRQSIGSPQFVPPGRCLVLLTRNADALWVTSWPLAEYVKHEWPGAWVCSCFRNESDEVASELIIETVAATIAEWPEIPERGMITFVDSTKVKPIMRRGKSVSGYCFLKAGFIEVGKTKGGLLAFQLFPEAMPWPEPANPRFTRDGKQLCWFDD